MDVLSLVVFLVLTDAKLSKVVKGNDLYSLQYLTIMLQYLLYF